MYKTTLGIPLVGKMDETRMWMTLNPCFKIKQNEKAFKIIYYYSPTGMRRCSTQTDMSWHE